MLAETVDRLAGEVGSGAMTESDAVALLEPLIAACRAQYPTRPFEDKLEEGLTKRVQPLRIQAALKNKLDDYAFARTLLANSPAAGNADALTAIGEGVSRGAPRADFEAYVHEFSGRPGDLFLAGADMTSLLGQVGFDYALTRSILTPGFEAGTLTTHWRNLIQIVLVARRRGLPDQATAKAAAEVMAMGGEPNDVAARLGFTSRDLTGRVKSN